MLSSRMTTSRLCSTRRLEICASNAGLEGGLEMRMSSTGSTIPTPMKCAQIRLLMWLENHGFSGAESHCASTSRRSLPFTSGSSAPGNFGGTGLFPTG